MTKTERLEIFQARLKSARCARTFLEGRALVSRILNEVEAEFAGKDSRMLPPLDDNVRVVRGRPRIMRLRSKKHNTLIGDNGSIELREAFTDSLIFEKPGGDGRFVRDL